MIFYFGLEGLGGLEIETDEDENVANHFYSLASHSFHASRAWREKSY